MGQAVPVTAVLNVVMMALAYLLARFLASGPRQRISISIECGLQNGTLAIAVATLLFGGGITVVPAATYSLIMFGTALIFNRHPQESRRADLNSLGAVVLCRSSKHEVRRGIQITR